MRHLCSEKRTQHKKKNQICAGGNRAGAPLLPVPSGTHPVPGIYQNTRGLYQYTADEPDREHQFHFILQWRDLCCLRRHDAFICPHHAPDTEQSHSRHRYSGIQPSVSVLHPFSGPGGAVLYAVWACQRHGRRILLHQLRQDDPVLHRDLEQRQRHGDHQHFQRGSQSAGPPFLRKPDLSYRRCKRLCGCFHSGFPGGIRNTAGSFPASK